MRLSDHSFVGRYSYLGEGEVFGDVRIGRFCSIAHGLIIIQGDHPMNQLSTHPFSYNNELFGWIDEYRDIDAKKTHIASRAPDPQALPLEIGNDVWIGSRVTVLSKVQSIGNGSIIGAGSVVTRDVPAYAVVAGNPANIIKYRFDPETIQVLEELRWWDLPLSKIKHLDFTDIESCIAGIEEIHKGSGA
jgi:acetyltransferase-like isoleucine patch superfamily enzyme